MVKYFLAINLVMFGIANAYMTCGSAKGVRVGYNASNKNFTISQEDTNNTDTDIYMKIANNKKYLYVNGVPNIVIRDDRYSVIAVGTAKDKALIYTFSKKYNILTASKHVTSNNFVALIYGDVIEFKCEGSKL